MQEIRKIISKINSKLKYPVLVYLRLAFGGIMIVLLAIPIHFIENQQLPVQGHLTANIGIITAYVLIVILVYKCFLYLDKNILKHKGI